MAEKLLPCPFCGAGAKVDTVLVGDYSVYYQPKCVGPNEHSLDFLGDTPKDAIREWNHRPQIKETKLKSDNTTNGKIKPCSDIECTCYNPDEEDGSNCLCYNLYDMERCKGYSA